MSDNSELNIGSLSMALRKTFLDELLGPRYVEYEKFLTPLVHDYQMEARRFLQPTFYDSPIGNAMPFAVATALQCSIVIFPVDTTDPTKYVSPMNVESNATAFVVYDPRGSGRSTTVQLYLSIKAQLLISLP